MSIQYPDTMPDLGPRDLDAMMAAAKRWEQMWIKLFAEKGVDRYRISYGWIKPGGEVESCDIHGCINTQMEGRFEAKIDACMPDGLQDEGDRMLKESGLGKFLYYDGWESGDCNAEDPFVPQSRSCLRSG